ncbi:MAG TPA: hypothetical protein VLC06_25050 [Polyangia bacterium]|nr:hypothetical protein [Polyangia bacterium]
MLACSYPAAQGSTVVSNRPVTLTGLAVLVDPDEAPPAHPPPQANRSITQAARDFVDIGQL